VAEPDDRPNALALSIMSAAVVEDLKREAAELSALFAALTEAEQARMRVLFEADD
jgi:hypothetical protein